MLFNLVSITFRSYFVSLVWMSSLRYYLQSPCGEGMLCLCYTQAASRLLLVHRSPDVVFCDCWNSWHWCSYFWCVRDWKSIFLFFLRCLACVRSAAGDAPPDLEYEHGSACCSLDSIMFCSYFTQTVEMYSSRYSLHSISWEAIWVFTIWSQPVDYILSIGRLTWFYLPDDVPDNGPSQ